MDLPIITRFAPSPTGDLHLGHAYSALYAFQLAGHNPAQFHLRIDDLDFTRCRPEFVQRQIDDLAWLGISWQAPPHYQSKRLARYQSALGYLKDEGFIYPCLLQRKEVAEILSAPQATSSLKGRLSDAEMAKRQDNGREPAYRLDMTKIAANCPELFWHDRKTGKHIVSLSAIGDAVIARSDIGASYHLCVVLDDHDSAITLVTRGRDLAAETGIHRLLQHLLQLDQPCYEHHPLIVDETGKRLAKRDDAKSLSAYREHGHSPDDIWQICQLFLEKPKNKFFC